MLFCKNTRVSLETTRAGAAKLCQEPGQHWEAAKSEHFGAGRVPRAHVIKPALQNHPCPGSPSLWGSNNLPFLTLSPGQVLPGNTFILSSCFSQLSLAHPKNALQKLTRQLIWVVWDLLRSIQNVVTSGIFNGSLGGLSSLYI